MCQFYGRVILVIRPLSLKQEEGGQINCTNREGGQINCTNREEVVKSTVQTGRRWSNQLYKQGGGGQINCTNREEVVKSTVQTGRRWSNQLYTRKNTVDFGIRCMIFKNEMQTVDISNKAPTGAKC